MKVALVHDFLTQLGGAERVLIALKRIFPKAPVYTLLYNPKTTRRIFKDWEIRPSKLQKLYVSGGQKFLLAAMPAAIESFDFSGYELVISSSNAFAKGIIPGPKTVHLSYCHSPMRYAWDWYNEYLEENNLKGITLTYVRYILHKLRLWDYESSKRVHFWMANSHNVRQRIWKYYRREAEVIYPPVNIPKSIPKNVQKGDYYLIVSRLSPYKKVDLAVEAFDRLNEKLLVVGEGAERGRLEKLAMHNPRIKIAGWQPDEEVQRLMGGARAFVHPQEEDFGITAVEAMGYGKPVIAYQKGGATETVVDSKTGLFFKESTADSLVQAIHRFEKIEGNFKPALIHQHAQKFSEERFEKEMLTLIENALRKARR